jgi:hypothetical protein
MIGPAFDPTRHYLVLKRKSADRMREAFGKDITLRGLTRLVLAALRGAACGGVREAPNGTARRYHVRFEAFELPACVELTEGLDPDGAVLRSPCGTKRILFVTMVSFPPGKRRAA